MKRFKRLIASIGAGLLVLTALMFGSAGPAFASASGTINGDVQCTYNGSNTIVGIWVSVASGTSGYASTSNDGVGGKSWSYHLSGTTSSYSLHVGCGGTPANWGTTYYTPSITNNNYITWYCIPGGCSQG